ncbi:MAG TPA: DUF3810 domain-containing protein [Vicinamibacteria bacterium]|nr:DUF3810 domain-containing protein [Vicinamibacteria bacterium]
MSAAAPGRAPWLTRALVAALVWTGVVGLRLLASAHPSLVEQVYARGVYPVVAGATAALTGAVPFSVAEMAVLLAAAGSPLLAVRAARRRRRAGPRSPRLVRVAQVALGAALVVLAFDLSWGLNYYREPVAVLLSYDVAPSTSAELAALADDLVEESRRLRQGLPEDGQGVMRLPDGATGALRRAPRPWADGGVEGLAVPTMRGRPKLFVLSPAMAYLGISGLFVPFTAEPTVNGTLPDWEIPFTASHEIAHQRGFAREDDANYVGYLACRAHPDPDFRYSGTFRAALYVLRALALADRAAYARARSALAPPLQRDLRALAAWAARYESRLGEVQEKVNDAYLKTQGQPEGVRSYGRMVDLLLAERRVAGARPSAGPGRRRIR